MSNQKVVGLKGYNFPFISGVKINNYQLVKEDIARKLPFHFLKIDSPKTYQKEFLMLVSYF